MEPAGVGPAVSLPDELWLLVLHGVSMADVRSLALVCKQFAALSRDSVLWRGLVASFLCRPMSQLELPTFAAELARLCAAAVLAASCCASADSAAIRTDRVARRLFVLLPPSAV
eukprot:TRINITY_DN31390_c0_g1_i1.p1 TRINITY_DN31390_c0_g1~~TRINITY_DN31390_c0_g1_i1.p1  ORF type:complete len:114 (-),score=14.28 TRINITY_DN31390_c0_g1_i1:81-422(-)